MNLESKTAYIFSGIDGLDDIRDRHYVVSIPFVSSRILQAQKILDKIAPGFDLLKYIISSDDEYKKVFSLQSIAVSVVQIGLFDFYTSNLEKPDYLMGCSLGDVARSFCAGAIDFDVVICACWNYHLKTVEIEGCAAYHVKVIDGIVTDERISEIHNSKIYFAVYQTPKHFIVTGTIEDLEAWRLKELDINRYRIKPIYDKPLHSPIMSAITEETYDRFSHTVYSSERWKYKMISSTSPSLINTRDDLIKDMVDNFKSTVYWMQALQFAVNELGVSKIFNIGPASTLLRFACRTPLDRTVQLKNPILCKSGNSSDVLT